MRSEEHRPPTTRHLRLVFLLVFCRSTMLWVMDGPPLTPVVVLVLVLDEELHHAASRVLTIRETSEGWKCPPCWFLLHWRSDPQMCRSDEPAAFNGRTTPATSGRLLLIPAVL